MPLNPRYQDGVQRLHQQNWEEGLLDPKLLSPHRVGDSWDTPRIKDKWILSWRLARDLNP
ncbi:hypothetical protein E2320_009484, partial [Naja naja]